MIPIISTLKFKKVSIYSMIIKDIEYVYKKIINNDSKQVPIFNKK